VKESAPFAPHLLPTPLPEPALTGDSYKTLLTAASTSRADGDRGESISLRPPYDTKRLMALLR